MLEIISVTRDDYVGIKRTIKSTESLRKFGVSQIVIDSSNKATSLKLKSEIGDLEGVRYYWCKPNGIANAFNFGLTKSTSKWIWFLNGGDEFNFNLGENWLVDYLSDAVSEIIIFDYIHKDVIVKKPMFRLIWPPVFNWVPHLSTIINREVLKKINFDEKYKIAMDGDLWMKLMLKDVRVDLVSIPIAKFFGGGVSDNLRKTSSEVFKILWNYKWQALKCWVEIIFRYIDGMRHFYRNSQPR